MKEESGRIFFFSSIVLFIYFSSVFVFIILSSLCPSYFCLLYVRPFYFLLHCSLCLSSIYIFSLYPSYVCFLSICSCIPLLSFFLIFIFCLFLSFSFWYVVLTHQNFLTYSCYIFILLFLVWLHSLIRPPLFSHLHFFSWFSVYQVFSTTFLLFELPLLFYLLLHRFSLYYTWFLCMSGI